MGDIIKVSILLMKSYIKDDKKIEENEYFPADLLLLKSTGKKNMCYIETKNLDGETNLKHKAAHKDFPKEFDDEQSVF